MTMTPSLRYRDFPGSDTLLICRECSGAFGYNKVVHRDRVKLHDRWHETVIKDSEDTG